MHPFAAVKLADLAIELGMSPRQAVDEMSHLIELPVSQLTDPEMATLSAPNHAAFRLMLGDDADRQRARVQVEHCFGSKVSTALLKARINRTLGKQSRSQAVTRPVSDSQPADSVKPVVITGQTENVDHQIRGLAVLVGNLLEVIVAQQQQISELSDEINVVAMQGLGLKLEDRVSENLHRALETAAARLGGMSDSEREVTIGTVTHKGTIKLDEKSDEIEESVRRQSRSSKSAMKVDIGVKLKGIAKFLAAIDVDAKYDTSNIEQMVDDLTEKRRSTHSKSVTGTFEVQHQGVSLKVKR